MTDFKELLRSYFPMRLLLRLCRDRKLVVVLLGSFLICWLIIQTKVLQNSSLDGQIMFHQEKTQMGHHTIFGLVNVHRWHNICPLSPTMLRHYPQFPLRPDKRNLVTMDKRFRVALHGIGSAQRIMGYLHPLSSSVHIFKLHSMKPSELWLSSSADPSMSRRLIQNGETNSTYLKRGEKYYFEILHTMNDFHFDEIVLTLNSKGRYHGYSIVAPYLSYEEDLNISSSSLDNLKSHEILHSLEASPVGKLPFSEFTIKTTKASNTTKSTNVPTGSTGWEEFAALDLIDAVDVRSSFSSCVYDPVYLKKRDYPRYRGATFAILGDVYSYIWPYDGSSDFKCRSDNNAVLCKGNPVIPDSEVQSVLDMFMNGLRRRHTRKYSLHDVVRVERKLDKLDYFNATVRGHRYLLELVLFNSKTRSKVKVSEYFYWFKNTPNLCKPIGLSWKPNATINVILTAKNQGTWVEHFIRDMAHVIKESRDEHVYFTVVDYGNNGLDIEAVFKRRGISNFTIIKLQGQFHKTHAINKAVSYVKDNDTIIFLVDLHLRHPVNIFDGIRKHTIQGKSTYTPILFRLENCTTPVYGEYDHIGFWERRGFGVFSAFKSDWDYFGGMNEVDFKDKWGGEDWEMADRVLNKGLDFERVHIPGLYHFFHNKNAMWDKAT